MFWRFGFANASSIDSLLDREDVSLEAILDEDELLQECKSQNTRLIDYFQRQDVLTRLFGFVSGEIEPPESGKHKYPYVATEVLCSEIWSIVEASLKSDGKLLKTFWENILNRSPESMKAQIYIASHFAKINSVFMAKKPREMWDFIKAQPNVVERLLNHLECEPFLDLLVRILHDPIITDTTEWFSEQRLVPRLVNMLSAAHAPDMHVVVTELISRIISMAAPSPGSTVGDGPVGPSSNRFARQLATRESVVEMFNYVLQDFPKQPDATAAGTIPELGLASSSEELPNVRSAMSSVVHSIAVIVELIRKNNSDYFEPYLFHTLRNRLIQIQQQQPAQSDEGRNALEEAFAEMVDRMGVVHLGPLLAVACENMEKLRGFLHKPRLSLDPVSTTVGAIAPLTTERYRICELFAELLHCSNMALLNRSASYDRLYDSEGRLQGGLSAMEALAQVIAMSNEPQRDDAMDESDDDFEPPEQLPVSNPDRSHSSIDDSDEDMSSDGGNLDEDMDDIAIDDTPFPVSAAPTGESPPQTRSGAPTPSPPSVSPSPSPAPMPIRKNSGSVSPMDSPVVRPRSSRSTRSFRRNSRRASMITELPSIGELLKRKMLDESILSDIMDLFFEFPWNNFLHSVVYDLVHQILNGKVESEINRDLIIALFRDARLMHRIVNGQKVNDEENAKPKGVRLGYMGHLTLMSEDVISSLGSYPPDLRAVLASTAPVPEWEEYVNGRYSETKQKDTSLLGGGKPVVAPGATSFGSSYRVDEADAGASGMETSETTTSGEFRRATGAHPKRESSADFGPAPIPEDEDDDDHPQFARYLAQEIQQSQRFTDDSDDEDDDTGGWLARSSFTVTAQTQPTLSRTGSTSGFDDTFGEPTNIALQHSFDDHFGAGDDDDFGPFSDSAATGDDPFTFSSSSIDVSGLIEEESATFDDFGAFGDFQSSTHGEDTPVTDSWSSFTSDGSSVHVASLSESLEEFGSPAVAPAVKDEENPISST